MRTRIAVLLFAGLAMVMAPSVAGASKLAVLPTQLDATVEGKLPPSVFDESLMTAVHELGGFEVVGQDDIGALIGFEKQKELLGCEETTCFAEIGGALGVDRLVVFKVALVGGEWAVTGKVILLAPPKVESRVTELVPGEPIALMHAVPVIVERLFAQAAPAGPRQSSSAPPPPSARIRELERLLSHASAQAMWPPEPPARLAELVEQAHAAHAEQARLVSTRKAIATAWTRCSERKDAEACLDAAAMARNGEGVQDGVLRPMKFLSTGCELGSRDACVLALAHVLLAPARLPDDSHAPIDDLELLCRSDYTPAWAFLRAAARPPSSAGVAAVASLCERGKLEACRSLPPEGLERVGSGTRAVGILFMLAGAVVTGVSVIDAFQESDEDGIALTGMAGIGLAITGTTLYFRGHQRLERAKEAARETAANHGPQLSVAPWLAPVPGAGTSIGAVLALEL